MWRCETRHARAVEPMRSHKYRLKESNLGTNQKLVSQKPEHHWVHNNSKGLQKLLQAIRKQLIKQLIAEEGLNVIWEPLTTPCSMLCWLARGDPAMYVMKILNMTSCPGTPGRAGRDCWSPRLRRVGWQRIYSTSVYQHSWIVFLIQVQTSGKRKPQEWPVELLPNSALE